MLTKANCGLIAGQWEAAAPLAFQARLAAGLGAGEGLWPCYPPGVAS